MLRRNSEFESFPTSGINRERSPDNNQLEQSTCSHIHLLRKGKSACLLSRRHSVQLWRPPDVNNNSEECKSHSGHVAPRTGNGMLIDSPSSSDLKSSSLLLEMYFPRHVFLHPTDRMCLPMLRPYTHSRAAKRPLAASLPATPALGHRRCLIVFTASAGLKTTLRCFQLLTGKKRIQLRSPSNSDACSQGSARPLGCHEKNCTSRIYGGVTHFVHMHQQSREDSVHQSSHTSNLLRSTLPPKWTPTRHRGEQASRKPPGQKGLNKTQCKNHLFQLGPRDQDHIS